MYPRELSTLNRWCHGPECFSADLSNWPSTIERPLPLETLEDSKTNKLQTIEEHIVAATQQNLCIGFSIFINSTRFHSWLKLVHTVTKVSQFLQKTRRRSRRQEHLLAPTILLRHAQTGAISPKDIDRWDLEQDADDLWRCTSRLTYSCLPRETKYPNFLPRHHPITKLLVIHCHNILHHSGVSTTLEISRAAIVAITRLTNG
ncbi:unnamed protein product [Toxocara canis]|uniref:Uncharacterized protein n=1 Tax=Toxocara canis TaxID=6265 RepID=A0A183UUX2_TOXCA|nr:unnamed protein product [Toxocara canis]